MEKQYGLSPRGGKQDSGNTLQNFKLAKHVKALSSSYDDLTRLDRHQPIIIQNFELLTPNQLKLRRRSLSTANLYLSNASLSRSGGQVLDENATITGSENHLPKFRLSPRDRTENIKSSSNGNIKNKHGVQPTPSPASSSSSGSLHQRGTAIEKQKRVTFSAQNTLHPYDPDGQTSRPSSRMEFNQFSQSYVILPPKRDASRYFQPFRFPDEDIYVNDHICNEGSYNNNHNIYKNNNNNNIYHNGHTNANCHRAHDVTAHNRHWAPQESLSLHKGAHAPHAPHANCGGSRTPQRSSLKQTMVCPLPRDRVNSTQGQSGMHSTDHSPLDQMTNGVRENPDKCIPGNTPNPNGSEEEERVYDPAIKEINTSQPDDHIKSIKSITTIQGKDDQMISTEGKDSEPFNENDPNCISNDDVDINESSTNDVNDDKTEDDDDDNGSLVVQPEPTQERLNVDFPNESHDSHLNPSIDSHDIEHDDSRDDDSNRATSFFDVFSNYNIPDNEYSTYTSLKKTKSDDNNAIPGTSLLIENIAENVDNKETPGTQTSQTISDSMNPTTTSSSDSKIIRLKFLVDSDNPGNLSTIQDEAPVESSSRDTASPLASNGRSLARSQYPKHFTSRQLKTKSTIEAVDLSTLTPLTLSGERPKSQGDVNAQFLMNMYSASGARKSEKELDIEANQKTDRDAGWSPVLRPPSRKPTDKTVSFSADDHDNSEHNILYRDPLSTSSRGRQKERQLLGSSRSRHRERPVTSDPLLKHRSSSAHGMMVTGSRITGKERVVAAEKFLLKTGSSRSTDRTALNRQLEQLVVSRSVSARMRLTMERSKSNLA